MGFMLENDLKMYRPVNGEQDTGNVEVFFLV
jgi:hypothetical protein